MRGEREMIYAAAVIGATVFVWWFLQSGKNP
jgi:hypothetical protein